VLLVSWLLIALVSLALVNMSIVLALILAVTLGMFVGFRYVRGIEENRFELP
jgi:uncharacterized protein YneF (UPF0154 family)